MSGTAVGFVLGFLVATAYGAAFHLFMGGRARRVVLYLAAAWLGFAIGHLSGEWFDVSPLKLGAVNLLSASVGAWLALIVSWWLVRVERG